MGGFDAGAVPERAAQAALVAAAASGLAARYRIVRLKEATR